MAPVNLWRQLEQTTLELLRTSGTLTVNRTDRSQRNLFLTLERMARANVVVRVMADGPSTTYRLPQ